MDNAESFDVYVLWKKIEENPSKKNLSAAFEELKVKTAGRKMTDSELAIYMFLKVRVP